MDIGMPTLLENKTLVDNVNFCINNKLDFIELNMNFPEYQLENLDIEYLRKIKNLYGIYFTIHLDENFNIADFNEKVKNAYLETMIDVIHLAKQIDSPVINMHLAKGIFVTLPTEKVFLYKQYNDFYMDSIKNFRNICENEIGTNNLKICIENTNGFDEHEKKAIEYLLQSKCFGLTFDIGHSHTADDVDYYFYDKHKSELFHMHFHDAKGKSNHLQLFNGDINLKQRFELAKVTNSRVVLETKTMNALEKSLELLRKILI